MSPYFSLFLEELKWGAVTQTEQTQLNLCQKIRIIMQKSPDTLLPVYVFTVFYIQP